MASGTRKNSRGKRGLLAPLIFLAGALFGALAFHFVTKAPSVQPALPVVEALPPAAPPASAAPPIKAPPIAESTSSPTEVVVAPAPAPPDSVVVPAALVPTVRADPPVDDTLLVPVSGIKARQLSDTFNETRGGKRKHEALDIPAPRGTPVIAAADGRIAKLFNSVPGGLTIYQFDAGEKLAYYYAHLDGYAADVTEGKQVKRGEVIGYVGSTGNASPATPHLHFAIFVLGPEKRWWQGTAVNPYPLLTSR